MTEHITVAPAVEVPDMRPAPELKVADRCDTGDCGAQAFVLTMFNGHELLWCGHHYAEHEDDLKQHVVIDARGEINQTASISANV